MVGAPQAPKNNILNNRFRTKQTRQKLRELLHWRRHSRGVQRRRFKVPLGTIVIVSSRHRLNAVLNGIKISPLNDTNSTSSILVRHENAVAVKLGALAHDFGVLFDFVV